MLVRLLKTVIPTDHFLLRVARRLRVEFGVHTLRDYDYEVLQSFDREYGYRICQKDGDTLAFAGFFRWLLMSLREGSGRH